MKKRIYLKDWLKLKPYEKQTATDFFYLKMSNEVKQAISNSTLTLFLNQYLSKEVVTEETNTLACFLTSYFEDVISETNIWHTFIKKHEKLYGYPLPFYPLKNYFDDEINVQDVNFLIWYFLNCIQDENYVEPINHYIENAAENVMEIFENAWDEAPENQYLKSFYEIDENEEDFYTARNLIDTLLFKTYLFYPDSFIKLQELELEIIEENKQVSNLEPYLTDNRALCTHKAHTQLLSLTGKEWLAEILGDDHKLSAALLNISDRITGLFLYKGQDDESLFIEHIATSRKFVVTKKSFDHSDKLKEIDVILFISIAQWKDEWWFSGMFFQQPFNADIVLDEKNSMKSRLPVNLLDHHKKRAELQQAHFTSFKELNQNAQIAFMPSDEVESFIRSFYTNYNDSLNLSDEEKKGIFERSRKDGLFHDEKNIGNFSEFSIDDTESGLVFFNPKRGIEIALGINSAFPLPINPFFNVEDSEDHVFSLFESKQFSTELAKFAVMHCKDDLPFFKKTTGKRYLKDLDFLLRFWKKERYHSKVEVHVVGRSPDSE